MDYAIEYNVFSIVVEGYNDVNWIFDSDEIKSTYVVMYSHSE